MTVIPIKNKHLAYLGGAILTLSLGFSIVWQKIIIIGPPNLSKNSCVGPYNISLLNSKNNNAITNQSTSLTFQAEASDGSNNSQNLKFYSDPNCSNQISSLMLVKNIANGQFYIKYVFNTILQTI